MLREAREEAQTKSSTEPKENYDKPAAETQHKDQSKPPELETAKTRKNTIDISKFQMEERKEIKSVILDSKTNKLKIMQPEHMKLP